MNAREINRATETIADNAYLRAAATLSGLLLLPLMGWALWTLVNLSTTVAVQSEGIMAIKQEMAARTADRYTKSEARADWNEQRGKDAVQDLRLERNARRLDLLEGPPRR